MKNSKVRMVKGKMSENMPHVPSGAFRRLISIDFEDTHAFTDPAVGGCSYYITFSSAQ